MRSGSETRGTRAKGCQSGWELVPTEQSGQKDQAALGALGREGGRPSSPWGRACLEHVTRQGRFLSSQEQWALGMWAQPHLLPLGLILPVLPCPRRGRSDSMWVPVQLQRFPQGRLKVLREGGRRRGWGETRCPVGLEIALRPLPHLCVLGDLRLSWAREKSSVFRSWSLRQKFFLLPAPPVFLCPWCTGTGPQGESSATGFLEAWRSPRGSAMRGWP